VGGNWARLLCLMLAACSPPNESKKAGAPAAAKDEPPRRVPRALVFPGPVRDRNAPRVGAGAARTISTSWLKTGFYDGNRFFRVVRSFVVQFGISGESAAQRLWASANLPDDPSSKATSRARWTYAQLGPEQPHHPVVHQPEGQQELDRQGFAPIGK